MKNLHILILRTEEEGSKVEILVPLNNLVKKHKHRSHNSQYFLRYFEKESIITTPENNSFREKFLNYCKDKNIPSWSRLRMRSLDIKLNLLVSNGVKSYMGNKYGCNSLLSLTLSVDIINFYHRILAVDTPLISSYRISCIKRYKR